MSLFALVAILFAVVSVFAAGMCFGAYKFGYKPVLPPVEMHELDQRVLTTATGRELSQFTKEEWEAIRDPEGFGLLLAQREEGGLVVSFYVNVSDDDDMPQASRACLSATKQGAYEAYWEVEVHSHTTHQMLHFEALYYEGYDIPDIFINTAQPQVGDGSFSRDLGTVRGLLIVEMMRRYMTRS